jgi:GGDEF domain-containing protein
VSPSRCGERRAGGPGLNESAVRADDHGMDRSAERHPSDPTPATRGHGTPFDEAVWSGHDELTGLLASSGLAEALLSLTDADLPVLIASIAVDRSGGAAGIAPDELMRDVGARLSAVCRAYDIVAVDTEAFVIACRGVEEATDAHRIARRCVEQLDSLGAFVGVSLASVRDDVVVALDRADRARSRAAQAGCPALVIDL